jgi:hypothetical protein
MRISEIKNCFADKRIQQCISHGFWENEWFRLELEQAVGEVSPDYVYSVIRETYLALLDDSTIAYKEERRCRKDLNRLSKLMYGQKYYWARGTKWEDRMETIAILSRRHEELFFLYERLDARRINESYDVIHKLAFDDELFSTVMGRERKQPIQSREDFFLCLEEAVMKRINNHQFSHIAYSIMNSVSCLAYSDASYWITKNNLDREEIKRMIVDDNERNETQ